MSWFAVEPALRADQSSLRLDVIKQIRTPPKFSEKGQNHVVERIVSSATEWRKNIAHGANRGNASVLDVQAAEQRKNEILSSRTGSLGKETRVKVNPPAAI